ncbi:MAG: 50S ribosomal protein L19 [Candidatus Bipolaricaulaceae bacterium]
MAGTDDLIRALEEEHLKDWPEFRAGDIVRIYERVSEGVRERLQPFEGVVLRRSGSGTREMVTVRRMAGGIGVERTIPLHSPKLERIEVVKQHHIRQSRPYWLRRITRLHKIQ